jgi:aspartate 1-decarboxylase
MADSAQVVRFICKSVIHNLVVTEAHPYCEGSILLDEDLMEAADIVEGERVLVASVTRGHRMETYAVPGTRGSGVVETSGSMSHLAQKGDIVCVMSFTMTSTPHAVERIDLDLRDSGNRLPSITSGDISAELKPE